MLKRAHKGVYHRLSPKHVQRYVSEFAGKRNIRDLDAAAQMQAVVMGMVGRRLMSGISWPTTGGRPWRVERGSKLDLGTGGELSYVEADRKPPARKSIGNGQEEGKADLGQNIQHREQGAAEAVNG